MARKTVKYTGRLGKPMLRSELDAVSAAALTPARGLGAHDAAIAKWLANREHALLLELLTYYNIAPDDNLKWFQLAQKLASAHVPAFRFASRVGRPRKIKKAQSLADILDSIQPKPKGKLGRKQKYTEGHYRQLLKSVREVCLAEGFKGHGAVTKALTKLISDDARRNGLSVSQEIRKTLNFFRRRYSEAKKKFPELA